MQDENVYRYLCDPLDPKNPCGAQVSKFNLIYVIATTGFSWAVLPLGVVLDRFGPKVSSMIGSGFMVAGCLLFAFSEAPSFDAFIPAYLLIGVGGPPIVFSFMHLSNLFPSNKGTIITMLNVALDASAMVFVLFDGIHTAAPETITYKWLFVGYTVLPALSMLAAIFVWPMRAFPEPEPEFSLDDPQDFEEAEMEIEDVTPLSVIDEAPAEERTFGQQVGSLIYWICAIFTAINLFRVNYYIGTINDQLLGFPNVTRDYADFLTRMFALILPIGGVLSVPVIGLFLDKMGLAFSIWALCITGLLYAGLALCTFWPVEVQYITFVAVAFFRALLFSVMATYVAVQFSFVHFGKLWGIVFLLGGIVNLAEYFLVDIVQTSFNGSFFWINVAMGVASVIVFIFPFYLLKHPPPKVSGHVA